MPDVHSNLSYIFLHTKFHIFSIQFSCIIDRLQSYKFKLVIVKFYGKSNFACNSPYYILHYQVHSWVLEEDGMFFLGSMCTNSLTKTYINRILKFCYTINGKFRFGIFLFRMETITSYNYLFGFY